jgi:hypothetical protein
MVWHLAQHQRVAYTLDFKVLRAINETQFFGDAHGQRITAFENASQHEVYS